MFFVCFVFLVYSFRTGDAVRGRYEWGYGAQSDYSMAVFSSLFQVSFSRKDRFEIIIGVRRVRRVELFIAHPGDTHVK